MEHLIVRLLQGCATEEERKRIRQWRGEAAENEDRFRALTKLWFLTGAAAPAVEEVQLPDVGALIDRAALDPASPPRYGQAQAPRQSAAGVGHLRDSRRFHWLSPVLKVAAMALLLIPLGFGAWRLAIVGESPRDAVSASEITTGPGERATITLQDGTSIRLGPRSRVELSDGEQGRTVFLDGRAFFEVAADSSRPFVVRTAHGVTTVLGTRFEVRDEGAELRVLVVEGRVDVSSAGGATELRAGEMGKIRPGEAPRAAPAKDVHAELAWMGKVLVFRSTPLEEAIREIEGLYGVTVVLETPSLSDLTVSAIFANLEIDDVAMIICEIIGARYSIDADTLRIERDGLRGGSRDSKGRP